MKKLEFLIIVVFIITVILFVESRKTEVLYIKSDIDNNSYLVRDVEDKQKAANLLARLNININKLETYLLYKKGHKNYKEFKPYIEQLNRKLNKTNK